MSKTILESALELSPAERIQLAEQLWDSVTDQTAPPVSNLQKEELLRRLDRLEKTGPLGSDWETVKARITGRSAS